MGNLKRISVGMMALATSDFLFCLVLIAGTGQWETFAISKDFEYFYQIFAKFVRNILVRISTWFTVILAVSRYYAVVYNPFRARQRMRYIHTLIAILTCIVIWILLDIPEMSLAQER